MTRASTTQAPAADSPAHLCSQGRRVCPCPPACQAPERCEAWGRGASGAASSALPTTTTTTLAASLLHLAVACAAVAALIFIVKTAASA